MAIVVFAEITAKNGQAEMVRENLKDLVNTTRAEPGCVRYDLYQNPSTPERFMFHEVWESSAALENHKRSVHFINFGKRIGIAIANVASQQMTGVAVKDDICT